MKMIWMRMSVPHDTVQYRFRGNVTEMYLEGYSRGHSTVHTSNKGM